MATFLKAHLRVRVPSNSFMSYMKRQHEEGATETFVQGAPVVMTAGLIVEGASPATDVYGIAVEPGLNNAVAAAVRSTFVPVIDGVEFFANFLGAAAADNVLAEADYSVTGFELEKAAILPGSAVAWYVQDAVAAPAANMLNSESDQVRDDNDKNKRVVVGDTNVRPTFTILTAIRSWL